MWHYDDIMVILLLFYENYQIEQFLLYLNPALKIFDLLKSSESLQLIPMQINRPSSQTVYKTVWMIMWAWNKVAELDPMLISKWAFSQELGINCWLVFDTLCKAQWHFSSVWKEKSWEEMPICSGLPLKNFFLNLLIHILLISMSVSYLV